jgi:hypothetical protein
MSVKPPLLYPDATNIDQRISLMKINKLMSPIITDGVAKLQNGSLSGLIDPVTASDCANLHYLQSSVPIAAGPNNSIQYNNNGLFAGSSNLTFTNGLTTTAIEVSSTTSSNVLINSGTISGLTTSSTDPTSAATKEYVDDTLTGLNQSTVIVNSSITYSANQMINGIIYRDPVSVSVSNTKFDTTASALSIISQFNDQSIGNSAKFYLKNISSSSDVYIYLVPGSSVTFNNGLPGLIIPQNYILKGLLIIQSNNSILLYVQSIEYSGSMTNVQFTLSNIGLVPFNLRTLVTDSLKNTNAIFSTYYDDSTIGNAPIPWSSMFFGQVSRNNLTGPTINYFPEPVTAFINSVGSGSFYRFIFRNGSAYNITLKSSNGYIFDSNADFTVKPMTSVLLWFYIGTNTITVYMIGRMNLS